MILNLFLFKGQSCLGCDGVPNSAKVVDACNVCGGNGLSCAGIYLLFIFNNKKRKKKLTFHEFCQGCDGVPNSGKKLDLCGVCGGSNTCLGLLSSLIYFFFFLKKKNINLV